MVRGWARAHAFIALIALGACASSARPGHTRLQLRPACPDDAAWNGTRCIGNRPGPDIVGRANVSGLEVEAAVEQLEGAMTGGPYRHDELVRLYEKLGIAYAFLQRRDEATRAFETLLTVAPDHTLPCSLSTRATFLFEQVRKRVRASRPIELDLSWPRDLEVTDDIPLEIGTTSDPAGLLARGTLHVRKAGDDQYRIADIELPPPGQYRTVRLPAPGGDGPGSLQLFVSARDRHHNEVYRLASPELPMELALGYTEPTPWYRNVWLWVGTGTAAALIAGGIVYALTREPPSVIDGSFTTR